MNLKTLKRFGSFTAAFVLMVTCLTGCTEGIFKKGVDSISETAQPSDGTAAQSEADSANDAAATEDYVAMMEGNPIYASDFYSCLYTAFSEVYYSSDIEYEDGATDDEKYEILLNYLEQKPEDSEKTYFEIAVDRALEICHTYHISGFLGEEKELLTDEDIESVITALDKTATDGAEYYGVSRDEFMTYYYGMNVNESKRYAILMSYAEKYMDYWLESNGYVLDAEDPAKPEEPGEDASESERDEYETALADYEIALAEYEKTVSEFYEQFRYAYEEHEDTYRIVTVRYLYVSLLDDEGNTVSKEEKQEKYDEINSYINLSAESGYDFEKVVNGFSESSQNTVDIDYMSGDDLYLDKEILSWASDTADISGEIKLFEEADGYYAVQIIGVTDFDKTEGETAGSSSAELIKEYVAYYTQAELYNDYVLGLTEEAQYALSDINQELMESLAKEYLEATDTLE